MNATPILIIERDAISRTSLRQLLERKGYTVYEAGSVQAAEQHCTVHHFALIISDLHLPDDSGTAIIKRVSGTPVLIMASHASLRSAVTTMQQGAVDYIAKPFDHDDLLQRVNTILNNQTTVVPAPTKQPLAPRALSTATDATPASGYGMIGQCAAMQLLFKRIGKVAPTDATVLIQGESGTGKELVAKALHANSQRAGNPIISVNCAAIPDTLIESELFGHEKGAFTGATAARIGLIAAAHDGTLFLDEIGELPLEAQARLLRVLQEGDIRRVGAVESQQVNVRFIAATHRNLQQLASATKFREDLYYRLNVVELSIPPLRERDHDRLLLAENLLQTVCHKLAKPLLAFSPAALAAIDQYAWPGNVRELAHAIERAVILSEATVITPACLGIEQQVASRLPQAHKPQSNHTLTDYFQRFVLTHQHQMTETKLAKALGISRKTLWQRRQKLGLSRKKARAD